MMMDVDSDSDIDDLLCPALPVVKSANVDQQPKDGLEYVWQVIKERKKCAGTVTVPLNKNFKTKQNIFIQEPAKTANAPDILLPTKEWQNHQEADFSEVRCQVTKLYNKKDVWFSDIKLPSTSDNNAISLWKSFFNKNDPVLTIVFPMTQTTLESVLEILIDCLNEVPPGEGILPEHGKWIFAILATLKLPLEPNLCSTLRDLARACSQIRSRLSLDDENVLTMASSLNLFICLVAKYFRQGDLAD